MNLVWLIYLIDISSGISALCCILSIGFFSFSLGFFIAKVKDTDVCLDEEEKAIKNDFKRSSIKYFIVGVFLALLGTALPSGQTGYLMLASHFGQTVYENTDIPEKIIKVINHQLDKYSRD